MRVLMLGGTGDVGAAVAARLGATGHDVLALARSDAAAAALAGRGHSVLPGDIRAPEAWTAALADCDALVHAAGVFCDGMAEIDRRLLDAILAAARRRTTPLRLVYTGGCWLYGDTGGDIATESSPYAPIPAFAYMVEGAGRLLAAPEVDARILHPAMVYAAGGGVVARFIKSARANGRIEVWGRSDNHWPVVERQDCAEAYRLVLEADRPGETFIAAAEAGVAVADIAGAIARRFGAEPAPVVHPLAEAVRTHGRWAVGPALDQRLSGEKLMRTLGWRPRVTDMLREIG